jgi:uncharacterized membrane protein YozB (DUF420 family)
MFLRVSAIRIFMVLTGVPFLNHTCMIIVNNKHPTVNKLHNFMQSAIYVGCSFLLLYVRYAYVGKHLNHINFV